MPQLQDAAWRCGYVEAETTTPNAAAASTPLQNARVFRTLSNCLEVPVLKNKSAQPNERLQVASRGMTRRYSVLNFYAGTPTNASTHYREVAHVVCPIETLWLCDKNVFLCGKRTRFVPRVE
ncbi:hypothetical protein J6590_037251 [Homalodisca vitripennis]|nr:hypothetical protein J6590_037251 [Homalodisca vitripennis]